MAKILVVDDSVDFSYFISELLKREGHSVTCANDGEVAINTIKESGPFDVILTDIIMPNMDGVSFMRHLQTTQNQAFVIAISGGGVTMASKEALKVVESLVVAVFEKPIDYDALIAKIAELVSDKE